MFNCTEPLGLDIDTRRQLEALSGKPATAGYSLLEDITHWSNTANLPWLASCGPMFVTTTLRASDPDTDTTIHAASGIWLDIDAKADHGQTIDHATQAAQRTGEKLRRIGVKPEQCCLYASGSKGYHVYVPLALMQGAPVSLQLARTWAGACRAFVLGNLMTDLTDLSLYCMRRGKLIRQPNVQRANGRYKVPMTWGQLQGLNEAGYQTWCSQPRQPVPVEPVNDVVPGAAMAWDQAKREAAGRAGRPAPRVRAVALSGREETHLKEALHVIEAAIKRGDLPYRDWIRLGSALKGTGQPDALETWEKMSRGHRRYREGDCASRWRDLEGLGIGTIIYIAQQVDRIGRTRA